MTSVAALLGGAGAVSLAIGAVLTKGVVDRLPPQQLIGPLFLLNASLVLPLAPWTPWTGGSRVAVLHLLSALLSIATAVAVFDLYTHGAASAVTTAQATSPLPAALTVMVLVPGAFAWRHVVAASIVVVAVLWAISETFGALGRLRSVATAAVASIGGASVTVLSRLLVDEGVALVEIYLVRTLLAGTVLVLIVPPRDIPWSALPVLTTRAVFITGSFAATILAVARGSPTVVQTMLALTPLLVLAWEARSPDSSPSPRILLSSLVAAGGVALLLVL